LTPYFLNKIGNIKDIKKSVISTFAPGSSPVVFSATGNATAIYCNSSPLPILKDIPTKFEIIKLCPEAVSLTCYLPF